MTASPIKQHHSSKYLMMAKDDFGRRFQSQKDTAVKEKSSQGGSIGRDTHEDEKSKGQIGADE
jgi:hypothetical protein